MIASRLVLDSDCENPSTVPAGSKGAMLPSGPLAARAPGDPLAMARLSWTPEERPLPGERIFWEGAIDDGAADFVKVAVEPEHSCAH